MDPTMGRTPSPGLHQQGYQLEDDPYGRAPSHSPGPGRLDIPMGPGPHGRMGTPSDRLMEQPTVSYFIETGPRGCVLIQCSSTPSRISATPTDMPKHTTNKTHWRPATTISKTMRSTQEIIMTLIIARHTSQLRARDILLGTSIQRVKPHILDTMAIDQFCRTSHMDQIRTASLITSLALWVPTLPHHRCSRSRDGKL